MKKLKTSGADFVKQHKVTNEEAKELYKYLLFLRYKDFLETLMQFGRLK